MLQIFNIRYVDVLFLLSICVISVYHGQGRRCLEGFVDSNTLRDKSALLGTFMTSPDKTQWIFPRINFTCSTRITSFRFVTQDTGEGAGKNKNPTIQIWRPQNALKTEFSKIHEVSANLRKVLGASNVFSYTSLSLNAVSGDILGFYQPDLRKSRYLLSFQSSSGRSTLRMNDQRDPPNNFRISDRQVESGVQDYPLIAISVANPHCVSGFLTLSELTTKDSVISDPTITTNKLVGHNNQFRLVPGLTFGCTGTLNSITFTAKLQDTSSSYPEVQLWRALSESTYSRQHIISLADSHQGNYLNTFNLSLTETIAVQPGDILGLFLPRSDRSAMSIQFLRSGSNAEVGTFPESYSLTQVFSPGFFNVNRANTQLDYDLPLMQVEIVVDCGMPSSPESGSVEAPSMTADSVATYSCRQGYNLVGVSERTCQSVDGEWSGNTPHCEPVDCGVPPSPAHGTVILERTIFLSMVRYECEHGYALQGQTLRTCTAQGSWLGAEPLCSGIECSSLAYPQNGRVVVQRVMDDTQVGAVAQYSCDTNHTLFGDGNRTCLDDQTWTGEAPNCVSDCPPPPRITNGSVEVLGSGQRTPIYSVASYYCDQGFMIHTSNGSITAQLVCGENSHWVGALPLCKAIDCGVLQPPEFGIVQMENGTLVDSVAYYNCSYGYEINGNDRRICLLDGRWSGNEPLCVSVVTIRSSTWGSMSSSTTSTSSTRITSSTSVPTTILTPPETRSQGPTEKPLSDQYLVIIIIIAVLTVIIALMVLMIAVLCFKRRKYKAMERSITMGNLNDKSVDNPVYEGDQRFSFNLWNSDLNSYGFRFGGETPDSSENGTLYEQPLQPQESLTVEIHPQITIREQPTLQPRPSLHYEVSSILNSASSTHQYDVPEGKDRTDENAHHYDTASNYRTSQYDLPASPYEVPTPTSKLSNIYGSLPWGTYVPTEEQRRSTSSSILSPLELSKNAHSQSKTSLDQVFFAESEVYWKPASDSASLYEQLAKNRYREILREQIQITDHLGSGQFGTVDKGLWQSPMGVMEVAVKTLKTSSDEIDKVKFLQEAAISGQFQHQNVVKLYGVVTMGEPVMIVLEILANGDLRNYLIRSRPAPGELVPSDTPELLFKFCSGIAAGMMYLSRKAFVHRDLAARNILVTENKTCKIGDFGLSRDLEDESYYISHGGKIPVKWTSPEALHYKKYSTASDVWSFGCVMYEIWSLGHKPFAGCTNTDTINLIDHGFRLPPPPGCPREIYDLMIHCWHPRTSQRPTFTDLHQMLSVDIPHILSQDKPEAGQSVTALLGAPLETSKDLYRDLQNFYLVVANQ